MNELLTRLPLFLLCVMPVLATAEMQERTVSYTHEGTRFESTVVFDDDEDDQRPGIFMVPNWMGATEGAFEKAKKIAGDDYVVMVVDLYGVNERPENTEEASELAAQLREDRELMRARAEAALQSFRDARDELPLKRGEMAAIGFCFGGGAVLELGRTGADLDAIVSFHGDLASPTLAADADQTKASMLVLHGADDPHVPQEDVQAFIAAMRETDVDWTLVQFSGAVHSFTNPEADSPGLSQYDQRTAKRAYEMMENLFDEVFDDHDD